MLFFGWETKKENFQKCWMKNSLGGGFKYFGYFHPKPWGRFPLWRAYFSDGWLNHQLDSSLMKLLWLVLLEKVGFSGTPWICRCMSKVDKIGLHSFPMGSMYGTFTYIYTLHGSYGFIRGICRWVLIQAMVRCLADSIWVSSISGADISEFATGVEGPMAS